MNIKTKHATTYQIKPKQQSSIATSITKKQRIEYKIDIKINSQTVNHLPQVAGQETQDRQAQPKDFISKG